MNYLALILVLCFGDVETDLELARARANLVSIPVKEKPATEPLPILQEKKQGTKIRVLVVTRTNCTPCELWKEACKNWPDCPYEFTLAKPNKSVSYPYYCWKDAKGNWQEIVGWSSREEFTREFIAKNSTKQQVVRQQTNSYNPSWTWPGNLSNHLQYSHGINTSGMSQDDMERAHDAAHESTRRGRR